MENMIKNFVVNTSMNLVTDLNKYDKTQLEEIKYGIESLYLTLSFLQLALKVLDTFLIMIHHYSFLV